MRLSRHAAVGGPAWCYIWFMCGTPLLLQLVFIYDVLPAIGIKLDTFTTAVIGFSPDEAGFGAEFSRSGMLVVRPHKGNDAATLANSPMLRIRRRIFPPSY